MECVLEVMEQPAERVKFRTEVKSFLLWNSVSYEKSKNTAPGRNALTRFTGIAASIGSYFWVR